MNGEDVCAYLKHSWGGKKEHEVIQDKLSDHFDNPINDTHQCWINSKCFRNSCQYKRTAKRPVGQSSTGLPVGEWERAAKNIESENTRLRLRLRKGALVNRTITSSVSVGKGGSGSYNWRIPSNQAPGSDYRIRVTSNSGYTDTSGNDFTIK